LMAYFNEGPTKHPDSLGEMISVAGRIHRTFVEPCYNTHARLGPCTAEGHHIQYCTVFADCPVDMMRFNEFPKRQLSHRTWAASRWWGYDPQGKFVLQGNLDSVPDTSVDVIFLTNVIRNTFPGAQPRLKYAYNKHYVKSVIKEAGYPKPYAVVQWRSERNLHGPDNYDAYIGCARQFRKQIEFHSKSYAHVYVVWDAHIEAKYNWQHLNLVVPRKYREDAHEIIMKPLNSSRLWRITPTGNVVHDMVFDHAIGSRGKLLSQCLRGPCQACSFQSGFTATMTKLFLRENPHATLFDHWV